MDPTLEHLDNLIKFHEQNLRTYKLTFQVLILIGALILILAIFVLFVKLFGTVEEDVKKIMLQFSPPAAGGIFTAALSILPHNQILPRQVKIERFRYYKNSYLYAENLPVKHKVKVQDKIREAIDRETQQ